MPSSAISLDGQALQVRRLSLGISPAFGQSSHLPSLVIWFNGQARQLRRSIFGTSPFGQFSQLSLFVIWVAGHSSEIIIIGVRPEDE